MSKQKLSITIFLLLALSKPAVSMEEGFVDLVDTVEEDDFVYVPNEIQIQDTEKELQRQTAQQIQMMILTARINGLEKTIEQQEELIKSHHNATEYICGQVVTQIQKTNEQVEKLQKEYKELATLQIIFVADQGEQNKQIQFLQRQIGKVSTIAREHEELKENQITMTKQIRSLRRTNRIRKKVISTINETLQTLKENGKQLTVPQELNPAPIRNQNNPSKVRAIWDLICGNEESQPLLLVGQQKEEKEV